MGTPKSRSFADETPYKRHLVRRSKGGVMAEVSDLRDDIDDALLELEQDGQLALYHIDTVDPLVSNDATQGYTSFSRWLNITSPAKEFVCLSSNVGAADWKQTTNVGLASAVSSVFGRTGNVVAAIGDYTSDQIINLSLVSGAYVTDALNYLLSIIPAPAPVSSVFGRTGAVVANAGDYNTSQVTNLSSVLGLYTTDALNSLNADKVDQTRFINTGVGLTGGGDLSANRTIAVLPHADGSIVALVSGLKVGVLATDAEHGVRGGGTQHAVATTSFAGFMSPFDKGKLDTIPIDADANTVFSVFGRVGDVVGVLGDYGTDLITNTSLVPGATDEDALNYLYDNVPPVSHALLKQLIHLADGVGGPMEEWASGSVREILPSGDPFPTSVTWYTDASKTKKIVEKLITRNSDQMPAVITWNVYNATGVVIIATVADTIIYTSGIFETSRTRAVS